MSLNQEQILATEHFGGVALNAGAGAGKTTVLIAHFFFRLTPLLGNEEKIKFFLKRTVLLTFSTKAALEIEHRLKQDLEKKVAENVQWREVSSQLNLLFIGTIHSFFLKVLKESPEEGLRVDDDILDEIVYRRKIETLAKKWPGWSNQNDSIVRMLSFHWDEVLATLVEIFQDPLMRENWGSDSKDTNSFFFEEIFSLIGIRWESFQFSEVQIGEHSQRPWYLFLNKIKNLGVVQSGQDFLALANLLEEAPRRPNRGKFGPLVDDIFEQIDLLKKFNKSYGDSLFAQFSHPEIYQKWVDIYQSLFQYIELHYDQLPGLSFADFEFKLLKKINDESFFQIHQEKYDYFIIDEFQDTSRAQYEILLKLGAEKNERFFVIGDIKQAIYGFRGGELQVFQEAQKNLKSLSLSNNYRSHSKITSFNNNFFKKIFPFGREWDDVCLDQHAPFFETQDSPLQSTEVASEGHVAILTSDDDETDFKRSDVKQNEIEILLGKLKKSKGVKSAILAKQNKTLEALIPHLMKENISFSFEMKIPFDENPLGQLILFSLKWLLEKNELSLFLVKYQIIQMGSSAVAEILLEKLSQYAKKVDLLTAVRLYIVELGFHDVSQLMVMNELRTIISLEGENPWKILSTFSSIKKKAKKTLNWGDSPDDLRLMTAHGSKGLEFDRVYLMGLWTSGRTPPDRKFLGNIAGSVKWKLGGNDKKSFYSLPLIYEIFLRKEKEFSENKRLFYVACTRAKKELYFLKSGGKFSFDKNSWGAALCFAEVAEEKIEKESFTLDDKKSLSVELNLKKTIVQVSSSIPHLLPDLSVTRLATVIQCPKKFYFENVLKWDENFLETEFFRLNFPTEAKTSLSDEVSVFKSSKERGLITHQLIENFVKGKLNKLPSDLGFIEEEVSRLVLSGSQVFSEKTIKFDFFGLIISGVIDFLSLGKKIEIWDFKTGARDLEKSEIYWAQLILYAYGLEACHMRTKEDQVSLKIFWTDEKMIDERIMSDEDIRVICFDLLKRTQQFSEENHQHCSKCQFEPACRSFLVSSP